MPCCAVLRCASAVVPRGCSPTLVLDRVYEYGTDVRTDESQQSRQGDKVGPKARGRVADATVATTTTPVGEAKDKRETPGSTRKRRSLLAFLGAREGLGKVCGPITHRSGCWWPRTGCPVTSTRSPHVPALFPRFHGHIMRSIRSRPERAVMRLLTA